MGESTRPVRIRRVASFRALAEARFEDGVNALCWERTLAGDFGEVVAALGGGVAIETLDEERLRALPVGPAGRAAVEVMLADHARLRERGLDPALNVIRGYPRDEAPGPVATDVFSFHADRADVEADTWLCTYAGSPSEGVANEECRRKVDVPEIRAALRAQFGGPDGPAFEEFLRENCYDLHYEALPAARPYGFGVGHLWRIAIAYPGCPVPPCVHRAPATIPGRPRLLLIS